MKKWFKLVLLIVLTLFIACGCSSKDDAPKEDESAEATASPTPMPTPEIIEEEIEPTPTPEPTPIPKLKISQYKYEELRDEELGVAISVPSHWIYEKGVNTLSWTEPVDDGSIPMRFSISVKKLQKGQKLSPNFAKKQLKSYLSSISQQFEAFKSTKDNPDLIFMNRSSHSCYYKAKLFGYNIRGFVIMSYVKQNNSIYVLHFYATQKKFEKIGNLFRNVMYSVVPIY